MRAHPIVGLELLKMVEIDVFFEVSANCLYSSSIGLKLDIEHRRGLNACTSYCGPRTPEGGRDQRLLRGHANCRYS